MNVDAPPGSDARAQLTALIGSVATGDRRALQAVYERTSAKLLGVIFKILPLRHEAEEVLQVVYVATGFLQPFMFLIGGVFAGLWVWCLVRARRIEESRRLAAEGENA